MGHEAQGIAVSGEASYQLWVLGYQGSFHESYPLQGFLWDRHPVAAVTTWPFNQWPMTAEVSRRPGEAQ
jgi:hypothetical protein